MKFKLGRLALCLLVALPALAMGRSGVELQHFDRSVRVQDDLFQAVNGGWLKTTDIPADESRWGAFQQLRDLSQQRVREILDAAVAAPDTPDARQLADFYRSLLDEAAAERKGLAPIRPLLDAIDAAADRKTLTRLLGELAAQGVKTPLNVQVKIDQKDATRYLAALDQSGLGLPERDYYLKKDLRFKEAREAYLVYLATVLRETGASDPARRARAVLDFETRLARVQRDKIALRDPNKNYNKFDRAGLARAAPLLDWTALFAGAEMGEVKEVDLGQPDYARALGQLIASQPLEAWRDYLRVRAITAYAELLHKPVVEAHFTLYGRLLSGQSEIQPRWKRSVAWVEKNLGESVGRRYVAKHFPAESKARMETLVGNLFKAFDQSIDDLGWMTAPTKAAAKAKLAKYAVKIGYPEKWRDYGGLEVRADDALGNALRGRLFDYRYRLARLGQPVDRDAWYMTPQTVNAYYNPSANEIVFPAGILQPPFFYADADDAVNYGAIGAVIGHEISHGFDDQGSQYDGDGNLRDWWQKEDRKGFEKLTGQLVAQYDGYEALPTHFVNGKLTLGENIADLSGLQIAFKGYQLSLGDKPSATIDGFSGEQRFFVGFAQVWQHKWREPALLQQLVANPHSPPSFRANGAAINSDAFHQAFGTKPGDGMYKAEKDRIRIW